MIEVLSDGLTVFLNGVFFFLGSILSFWLFVPVLLAVSLMFLFRYDLEELDRQGFKPDIGLH